MGNEYVYILDEDFDAPVEALKKSGVFDDAAAKIVESIDVSNLGMDVNTVGFQEAQKALLNNAAHAHRELINSAATSFTDIGGFDAGQHLAGFGTASVASEFASELAASVVAESELAGMYKRLAEEASTAFRDGLLPHGFAEVAASIDGELNLADFDAARLAMLSGPDLSTAFSDIQIPDLSVIADIDVSEFMGAHTEFLANLLEPPLRLTNPVNSVVQVPADLGGPSIDEPAWPETLPEGGGRSVPIAGLALYGLPAMVLGAAIVQFVPLSLALTVLKFVLSAAICITLRLGQLHDEYPAIDGARDLLDLFSVLRWVREKRQKDSE